MILELLHEGAISSQEQLRIELKKKGCHVTQATLSRDFRELAVRKAIQPNGMYKYETRDDSAGLPVKSLQSSGNLLVLRTEKGMAPVMAYRIDETDSPAILGTVAGEDTLLVVIAEGFNVNEVRRDLCKKLGSL